MANVSISVASKRRKAMTIMIELSKKTIEDIAEIVEQKIEQRVKRDERLYKLKEISAMLNISERTLNRLNIPYRNMGKNTRKMYSLSEVRDYLKR
jgi:AraC-like DNA-binding protein